MPFIYARLDLFGSMVSVNLETTPLHTGQIVTYFGTLNAGSVPVTCTEGSAHPITDRQLHLGLRFGMRVWGDRQMD